MGSIFSGFWVDLGLGLVTEFGEFQERVGIRNYIHLDPSLYSNYRQTARALGDSSPPTDPLDKALERSGAPQVARLAFRHALSIDFSHPKSLERGSERLPRGDLGCSGGRPDP